MAVVYSELEKNNYTGFGISAGGGMCNICLSCLSVPYISFSIPKGGDYIDNAVATVTREVNTRIRDIKENTLDLLKKPVSAIEDALHIYYDDLIQNLVIAMKQSIEEMTRIPTSGAAIPVVLSGGTVMPNGFKEKFEACLNTINFPLAVSDVRLAENPLTTTASGALVAAMYNG